MGDSTSIETLKDCGVDEAKLTPTLTVTPAGVIQIKNSQDSTRNLIVSGGRAPYMAELLESSDKIAVSQPVPFGPRISVEVKKDAPVGDYNIYVSDVAGNSALVKLTISTGSATSATAPKTVRMARWIMCRILRLLLNKQSVMLGSLIT